MVGLRWFLVVAVALWSSSLDAADPPCDLNADGRCDISDLDSLGNSLGSDDPIFDLNGDGNADLDDRDEWLLTVAIQNGFGESFRAGDANLDGVVDAQDLMTVGQNWQGSGVNYSNGDFNMDDHVNALDLNLVGKNWLSSISAAAVSDRMASVPEPSGALLWLVMSVGISCAFRQKRCAVVLILSAIFVVSAVGDCAYSQICDLDGDADCDVEDVGQLSLGKYDLDGDGAIDLWSELDVWLESAGEVNGFADRLLAGDSNLDGTIDAFDLNAVGRHWQQQSGATWDTGDFNFDGQVNASDLMTIGQNWQMSVPRATVSVPEPAGYLVGFVCVLFFYQTVRRIPAATVSILLVTIIAASAVSERTHGQICDLDGDADCDVEDVDQWTLALRMPFDAKYDLDGDGVFRGPGNGDGEMGVWLTSAGEENGFAEPVLLGDSNLDGAINAADLNALGRHWHVSGATTWSMGDSNLDGIVDAADLMTIGRQWQ